MLPIKNNCPYANKEVLDIVRKIREVDERNRRMTAYYANLYTSFKARLRSQKELDEHRKQGHIQFSPDCPECKKGAAKQRPHFRCVIREGGELSVDIGGPYPEGLPVTDQPNVARYRYPKYMLVGAFIPFNAKEAQNRYDKEVRDRHAIGLEGPVLMEQFTKPDSQTLYFVEVIPDRSEATSAIRTMITRIENLHKGKAVYRVHVDRAKELTTERFRRNLAESGVLLTTTAG